MTYIGFVKDRKKITVDLFINLWVNMFNLVTDIVKAINKESQDAKLDRHIGTL